MPSIISCLFSNHLDAQVKSELEVKEWDTQSESKCSSIFNWLSAAQHYISPVKVDTIEWSRATSQTQIPNDIKLNDTLPMIYFYVGKFSRKRHIPFWLSFRLSFNLLSVIFTLVESNEERKNCLSFTFNWWICTSCEWQVQRYHNQLIQPWARCVLLYILWIPLLSSSWTAKIKLSTPKFNEKGHVEVIVNFNFFFLLVLFFSSWKRH